MLSMSAIERAGSFKGLDLFDKFKLLSVESFPNLTGAIEGIVSAFNNSA